MRVIRYPFALGLLAVVLGVSRPSSGQEGPGGADPDPARPEKPVLASDASTAEFKKALDLQKQKKWAAAKKALESFLVKWPDSVHKDEAEERSDDNAYLGTEVLHRSGPSERRIDVAVMGDGFTIDAPDQALEEKWAKLCLDVLWSEASYGEYRDYFNYYFVRLASLEEGVDPALSPEEKKKIEEKNKTRTRKRKTEYSTALDCKAAGPQGQVMADRRLVYHWLKVGAREVPGADDDGLVIAFARFGILGMGGGGVANVGRPDRSVTVHEFGHAFGGLLDEYAVNPTKPPYEVRAANASMTNDPAKVPWAHFLEKKVPGVGVFEGGATFKQGVWKPARSCAMNSAGNMNYCPVCREAVILRIYNHCSPIDAAGPVAERVTVRAGQTADLFVVPMRPEKHDVEVQWWIERLKDAPPEVEVAPKTTGGDDGDDRRGRFEEMMRDRGFGRFTGGKRGREDRKAYDAPPPGAPFSNASVVKRVAGKDETRHVLMAGRLEPGWHRITAEVRDPTPWVLKDSKHLLEERRSWFVNVLPK